MKFCSLKCYRKNQHKNSPIAKPKICVTCNKEFFTYKNQIYCSYQCRADANSSQVSYTCEHCKKEFFDKISTKRKYCSQKCKNISYKKGPDNPLWKGGGIKYRGKNWKTQSNLARIRDNFTCQICGIYQVKPLLTVHHIKPYRKFNGNYEYANRLENLITLCRSCHSKVEKDSSIIL